MNICTYFFFVCNGLHLIESCLGCLVEMYLYSNNFSTIATVSSLFKSELLPACFSCNNHFNLSHNSLGSDVKNLVFEISEAKATVLCDLSNFISV